MAKLKNTKCKHKCKHEWVQLIAMLSGCTNIRTDGAIFYCKKCLKFVKKDPYHELKF